MFKRYPKGDSRTLINFPSLDVSSGDAVIVCMTKTVLQICRKLLVTRGMWSTTYVNDYEESGYNTPSEEGMKLVRERISEFLGDTNVMNCQDFINALNSIAASITASSCCGAGSDRRVLVGDDVYYGTQQPVDRPTTFGPGQEFATEEDFLSHMCLWANNVVDGIQSSLRNWSILTLATLIGAGVLGAVFIASPPLAVLIAISTIGLAFSVLVTMADYINTNREEWVCAFYSAESYSAMLVTLDELVENMVIANSWGFADAPIKELFRAMVDTDTLNKGFTSQPLPPVANPSDCDCGEPGELIIITGQLVSGTLFAPATGYNELVLTGVGNANGIPICIASKSFQESGQTDLCCSFIYEGLEVIEGNVSDLNNDGYLPNGNYSNGLHFEGQTAVQYINFRSTTPIGQTVEIRINVGQTPF